MSTNPIKMKEKKVLIIAYYFPPLGVAGVQRVNKFVKYLPLFGWKPYILTLKEVKYLAKDLALLNDIPEEAEIIRTGSFDPLRVWFILGNIFKKSEGKDKPIKTRLIRILRLFSWLFFPDNKVGWIPFALMKGLSLCRREKMDLIFSSSPPPSLHLTGYLLKVLTGIPWIADFRDPWTGYKLETLPTPVHLFLKRRIERLIVSNADRVITANPAIKGEFEKRHPHSEKIFLVDQGYDEEDFGTYQSFSSEIFTIGYLGTFSPDCNPEPFFASLGELINQGMIPKEEVKFVHVGLSVGIDSDRLIEKYKLKEVVQQKGYLSHPESLEQIGGISLLLLVTSDHPLIFPAKVFEYIRLKKPILGIVPPKSEIAKFLTQMKVGKVVSPEDKKGIKEMLSSYFSCFKKGKLPLEVNEDKLKRFERRSLTFKLSSLLDEVIGV
ncbi:MAG: glycosyltransferase [candidate division Zixibacteria bacterium]|nr:glycosyltransferase [candidate division Zixibacteria bacterium]